ncbi:hypothetical protein L1987_33195 [Smallanthus sonchifolius]|uniref:Uncharacterized protein n=1 Tax=Smallanthus sonchifolius TaxID=185202 RepID=A0ACB9HS21_9ASTR|nr:hypothetical protein L1987_33195 [Smallanthus sonchifolius]
MTFQLTTQKNNNQILTERLQKAEKENFHVEHMGMDQKILFGIIDKQIHKKVTKGIGYNSHPPPYSKSDRFADMPAPHVPTPFVCKLSADNYIKTSDSDSFASHAESDCVGSKDDCDESSSNGNVLNELKSDECNNMSVSKQDICEHVEKLYFDSMPSEHDSLRNDISKFKNALPFVPKSVNAMSCIANFKSAGVIVTDIPQEIMSNLEFFRLKEDQSVQERLVEERVASSSDVLTSQSSSSFCDNNNQDKPSCDKLCFSCGESNHVFKTCKLSTYQFKEENVQSFVPNSAECDSNVFSKSQHRRDLRRKMVKNAKNRLRRTWKIKNSDLFDENTSLKEDSDYDF